MNKKLKAKYYFYIALFLFYSEMACAFWPDVSTPPQSTESKIADEIFHNGIANRISMFNSRLLAREVLSFYRNKWADKFSESQSGPWQQISRLEGKYFINVQVQDDISGSKGRITITELPKKLPKVGLGLPMMNNSNILNEVITKDKNSISTVTLLMNKHGADANRKFYEMHYTNAGWRTMMAKDLQQHGGGLSLVFNKGKNETIVTINKVEGKTTVLLNKVEKKSWFN